MTDRSYVAHLRHELRTPLNHVIGYAEMLLEDPDVGEVAGLAPGLTRIRADAQEILARINDFLAPARLDASALDLSRLPGEVGEPLAGVIAEGEVLAEQARQHGLDPVLPDLARITQAAERLARLIREGVAPPSVAPSEPAPAPARPPPPAAARADPAAPATILVVDDNLENREMLGRRLARDGHRIRTAADGRAALAALETEPADLVLLDVMMPDLDGYGALQRLKADERLRDIPVLMISALDELDSVVRCIELGAEDYLPKPFDPVLLRARIGACLEKKRLRDREVRYQRELAEWNETLERRVQEQVGQLERLSRLKRFFSPQLAEAIVAGGAEDPLRTHRREVTVVFLDLRGFTAFAETAEPEEVMGVLREYHAEMGQLILAHEGTLERFTGDGMMVFFNDPVVVPNPAERAMRMVLAMRDRVAGLVARWRKRGYLLDFGVGIAQGYATIGAIGFEGRWDYGAIGTVTNLAARLCGEAKPGQVLISLRVLGALEELVEVESVGELALKGFLKPVPVFNVVGLAAAARPSEPAPTPAPAA
jgi:class 3 adenylate cyclase